ncbi:protein YCF54, chloroplastic [Euphorbia lathyris]|uniref:protein YCF54, chloroplastic n=1 Tax=Euphorbia lathyris TaxID=212925 RepID=UPI003313AEB1
MLSLAVGSSASMAKLSPHCVNGRNLAQLPTSNLVFKGSQNPSYLSIATGSISSFKTAVAAIDSNELGSSSDKQQANKYYFVVANAKFMLDEEEHFKELLFERLRMYEERNKEQDFWLVIEPKFLDKFPNFTKRLNRPAVALVSTNGPWITYMKLRLDRVLSDSYEADTIEEALASNPTTIEFEKPEKWVAPYAKYEYGWWESFLPAAVAKESKV